jgi:hypothetical protein
MAPRIFRKVIVDDGSFPSAARSEPFIPVYTTPTNSQMIDKTADVYLVPADLNHFADSKYCAAVTARQGSVPDGWLTFSHITGFGSRRQLCPDCFNGRGLTQVHSWLASAAAPQIANRIVFHSRVVTVLRKMRRVRKGHQAATAYAAREIPGVLTQITSLRVEIAALSQDERQWHQEVLSRFEESSEFLMAFISPGQSTYVIDKVRAALTAPPREWVVLDETPTMLVLECHIGIPSWRNYGPALYNTLRLTTDNDRGEVLYGPRFAIDFIQRTMSTDTFSYCAVISVPDPQVAQIATGLWDITGQGGLRDMADAIATAQTLVALEPSALEADLPATPLTV